MPFFMDQYDPDPEYMISKQLLHSDSVRCVLYIMRHSGFVFYAFRHFDDLEDEPAANPFL